MPTSSRLADRATTLLALHQPGNPVMYRRCGTPGLRGQATLKGQPVSPRSTGRISFGPFLQTALGTRAKAILAGWG
jgi:hypothetical protein